MPRRSPEVPHAGCVAGRDHERVGDHGLAFTMPLNVDIGASTLTIGAVTLTDDVRADLDRHRRSSRMRAAVGVLDVTSCAASSSTTWCPDCHRERHLRGAALSSNSSRLSAARAQQPDVVGLLRASAAASPCRSRPRRRCRAARRSPGLERDDDLAAHLGQDLQALVVVGVRRAQRRPGAHVAVAVGAEPGELHLDPAEASGSTMSVTIAG